MVVAQTQLGCKLQTLIEVCANFTWGMYQLSSLPSSLLREITPASRGGGDIATAEPPPPPLPRDVGGWPTEMAGSELLVKISEQKCPWRSGPHWQVEGVMKWGQWPGRHCCRSTRHTCMSVTAVEQRVMLWYIYPKGNIKSFIGVIPRVNMIWIYDEKL